MTSTGPVFDNTPSGRTTSTLNDANNDTGRTAWCGPTVISAISGFPVSQVEEVVRQFRGQPKSSKSAVVGTYAEDVETALAHYGYRMVQVENYLNLSRRERPTLWSWMQKPRNAWAHYVLGVHKGKEGHWILIKGVKMCDTFTEGRWQFVCDGPHKGCRIMEVFEVKKQLL